MAKFVEAFNQPGFLTNYNPFFLKDMSKAMERAVKAINNREKIVLYGACDADAICGVSLLLLLFKYLNADVEYYIHDSISKSLSTDAIRNHISFLGAKLIITVGCSIESELQASLCKEMSMDVLVLDNCEEGLSFGAICVNPKQKECLYKFKFLSYSGVAYKLAQALSMYYDMKGVIKYTDLVSIGTIASELPLEYENEILAYEGLEHISKSKNRGVKALIKVNGIENITLESLKKMAACIKPTMNVVGKMDNARIAVELFTTSDGYRASQIAKYLSKEVNNYINDAI
ncbi:delta(24)-sterol C-methyltransferase [Clostridium sp. 19966]|uniref:DHH family phosphoesterase n=1 Tax=Clostridium sp. 19966 TaxID=2768166 RepID=UPI0028DDCAB4|nr:DHH family phosphoesterase [Clostridium sp. 19966]MDT8717475.1 delta(24)-sterol C-methyltransferase [Clostridium sp. 19966]